MNIRGMSVEEAMVEIDREIARVTDERVQHTIELLRNRGATDQEIEDAVELVRANSEWGEGQRVRIREYIQRTGVAPQLH